MVHLSDEILFSNKRTSYNATKIHRENLNAYCLGKLNCKKATNSEIPNVWHSGKSKAIETQKTVVNARGLGTGGKDE